MSLTLIKIIKLIVFISIIFDLTFLKAQTINKESKPNIFFDLGNVLINTNDKSNLHYISGALDYLKQLKYNKFNINIIANIPEKFGSSCKEKAQTLLDYINQKWQKDLSPFPWKLFDHILLPVHTNQRKPNPFLFIQSLTISCPRPVLYISENIDEIVAAKFMGLAAWQINTPEDPNYMPVENIINYTNKNFRFIYVNKNKCSSYKVYDYCDFDPNKDEDF